VDVLYLDARLKATQVELARAGGPNPDRVRADAAAIVALYRGPLLPGLDTPWAAEARLRLRRRLDRWVTSLAALPDDPADAEVVRRSLADVDPELRGDGARAAS